ncbi:hypothetical protein OG474_42895 [Kribbella sp. NBC_01505]|uniref:hypothetical protein n=1 Tax=Kribbella sp. NBC_01505 TaxID=2903580 RepID=UPI00386643FD
MSSNSLRAVIPSAAKSLLGLVTGLRTGANLREAFPAGVCDYKRPGPGEQPAAGTWIDYSRPFSS